MHGDDADSGAENQPVFAILGVFRRDFARFPRESADFPHFFAENAENCPAAGQHLVWLAGMARDTSK